MWCAKTGHDFTPPSPNYWHFKTSDQVGGYCVDTRIKMANRGRFEINTHLLYSVYLQLILLHLFQKPLDEYFVDVWVCPLYSQSHEP